MAVNCPICSQCVKSSEINSHIDSGCSSFIVDTSKEAPSTWQPPSSASNPSSQQQPHQQAQKRSASSFFSAPATKRRLPPNGGPLPTMAKKRAFDEGPGADVHSTESASFTSADAEAESNKQAPDGNGVENGGVDDQKAAKRTKTQQAAPLAERMRPRTLDEVCGQDLVGLNGVLRSLIESDRVPSMILWGAPGTGKTTIARCIAQRVGSKFVELNATSSGVSECKRIFGEAARELALTGRKTVLFCDEVHRFSKAQQEVFLAPVEAGTVTLIGATTENPSFRVAAALLSRCRTFALQPLTLADITGILRRASAAEQPPSSSSQTGAPSSPSPSPLLDDEMLECLARFSDGDARTALNLLELALSLQAQPGITKDKLKAALTKTFVYDRGADQHYDSISAFHKSVRGGDGDAALYYLARMLQSGEDALFIARRMVVIASEDIGLADNSLLPLATATYTATQQLGMPEARIPLAHCALALCLAPKSTRAYRALNNAAAAMREPGVASLPVPLHLRNAPTRLMRDMGYGAHYKYPPNYRDGKVRQTYLPPELAGRRFVEERDLGTEVDVDMEDE